MKVLFTCQLLWVEQKNTKVLTRTHVERNSNTTSMRRDMIRLHVVNSLMNDYNASGHMLALLYLNIVPPKADMEPQELWKMM